MYLFFAKIPVEVSYEKFFCLKLCHSGSAIVSKGTLSKRHRQYRDDLAIYKWKCTRKEKQMSMKTYSFLHELHAEYIGRGLSVIDLHLTSFPQHDEFVWLIKDIIQDQFSLVHPHHIYRQIIFDEFPSMQYRILVSLGMKMRLYLKIARAHKKRVITKNPWSKQTSMRIRLRMGRMVQKKYKRLITVRGSIRIEELTLS